MPNQEPTHAHMSSLIFALSSQACKFYQNVVVCGGDETKCRIKSLPETAKDDSGFMAELGRSASRHTPSHDAS